MDVETSSKVLIIDDEADNIRLLGLLLRGQGHAVHWESDSAKAVAAVRSVMPDLVLLDVMMPEPDGFAVCRQLQQEPATAQIPVIFLTAKGDPDALTRGLALGAVDYVTKPFAREELLARVHTHTRLGRLTRDLEREVQTRTRELDSANLRLRQLASELVLAGERERRQLAGQLHDATIQRLALVQLQLDSLTRDCADMALGQRLAHNTELVEESIRELRGLVFELSPPVLYELGLDAALDWLAQQGSARWNLPIGFSASGRFDDLPQQTGVLLFQSVRELITNLGRHASARQAQITARRDAEAISVQVADDGVGCPGAEERPTQDSGGYGLFSIRQRMEQLGGRLETDPAEPGCSFTLILPLPHEN